MTVVGKKICSIFLTVMVVTLLCVGCLLAAFLPKSSEMIELVTKFSGVILKSVPLSVCCTFNYSNSLIRSRTMEDTFYSVTEGESELQKNISIQQFNERNFFAEENDLPVLTDVPDEKSQKNGQKWWPVPLIAVSGIALIAVAEKILFGRNHKPRKIYK